MNSDNNKITESLKCTKPNCDCVEKAIEANGGNEVKNYPCLYNNIADLAAEKSGTYGPERLSNFINSFSPPTDHIDLEAMAEKFVFEILIKPMIKPHDSEGFISTLKVLNNEDIKFGKQCYKAGYTANTTAQTTMDKVYGDIENLIVEIQGHKTKAILHQCKVEYGYGIRILTNLLTTLKKNI